MSGAPGRLGRRGRLGGAAAAAAAAVAAVLALAVPASAHKPLFVEPGKPLAVADGTVSYAAYGRLACPGDRAELRARLRQGDTLFAELLVPAGAPEGVRSSARLPRLTVLDPAGAPVAVERVRARFDEPFSGTSYLRVARLQGTAALSGTYRLVATGGLPGRIVLAVGTVEQFGGEDMAGLARKVERVRAWAAEPATRCSGR